MISCVALCTKFHVAFALFALFAGCTRWNKRGDGKRRGPNGLGIDSGDGDAARRREILVQTDRGTNGHCNADRRTRLAKFRTKVLSVKLRVLPRSIHPHFERRAI